MPSSQRSSLSREDKIERLQLLEEKARRKRRRKLLTYFPDTGPLRRELYIKHLQFFAAGSRHEPKPGCPRGCNGKPHRERLFLAANRVGKTESAGGFELTLHLTGRYPDWWRGARFAHPIDAWAAGTTRETTRDILQVKLLGTDDCRRTSEIGTGLIPGDDILDIVPLNGKPGTVEKVIVRNEFDKDRPSLLAFKSFDQKRKAFEGTEKHVVLLDEEAPIEIYTECLLRTMTVGGHILCTFTPLQGLTALVLEFLPGGKLLEDEE